MAGYKRTTRNPIYLISVCSLVLGCQVDLGGGSSRVQVQALPEDSSFAQHSLESYHIEPHKPLQLDFSGKHAANGKDGIFLFRRTKPEPVETQGHNLPGSVQVADRDEPWQGMLLNLPPLDLNQAHAVSLWVKTVGTGESTRFSLMLTRIVDGLSSEYKLAEELIEPGSWSNIKGEFYSAKQKGDIIHTVHLNVQPVLTRYLIDDVSVGYAEYSKEIEASLAKTAEQILGEHVRNGDVEQGLEPWSYQGGQITRSVEQAHSGKHSILITERAETWNAPVLPLQGLKDSVRYKISVFTRLRQGELPADMKLTLKRVTNGQSTFVQLATEQANDANWVEVSGIFTSANISQSESTYVYLESFNPTVSYYVDSVSVQALPDP